MNLNNLNVRVDGIIDYMRRADYRDHETLLADAKWLENNAERMATETLQLRNISLASEIYDLCGAYSLARNAIHRYGKEAQKEVRKARKEGRESPWWTSDKERTRLLRQRLWVIVNYGNALYRTEPVAEIKSVLTIFRECQEVLDTCLPLEREAEHKEPSYGLRSRIAYSEAVIHLRREDFDTARKSFSLAMDLQQQRFDAKLEKFRNEKRDEEVDRERAYGRYMAAKIFGLGLGWCSLRAGELHRARAAIACARTIFEACRDDVHKGFMELLYATTLRMENRNAEHRELDKAIKLLSGVSSEDGPFHHHDQYRARALYELAFARLEKKADDPEIDRLIQEVENLSKPKDVLTANARLLRSRKQRLMKSYEAALKTASAVRTEFESNDKVLVRALVAEAEARIDLGYFNDADDDLQRAMTLARGNPLLMGICHLHRSQCLLEQHRSAEARDQLDRWRALRPRIEDGYAIKLSDTVEARILGGKGLWLSREETLNYKLDAILDVVTRQALEAYRSEYGPGWVSRAAVGLGKGESTIYELAEKCGVPRQSPRPKTPKG